MCVQDISDELALSRSKLYRKIKELTGKSANEMIRKMRLEKSKELLTITEMTIGEICYKVGFSSHPIIPRGSRNILVFYQKNIGRA